MPSSRPLSSLLLVAGVPLLLAIASTTACYLAAGPSLGLFIGGFFVATLLAPPLVLWRGNVMDRVMIAASVIDGVAIVWLVAVFTSETTFAHWLAAYVLLAAYVTALQGLTLALRRARFGDVGSSAITITLALAWLTWPIWLSAVMTASVARWLTAAHPLLALNGLLMHLGVWGEGRIAYQITNLGQDVPYHFPSTVIPAIVLHGLIGGALLLVSRRGRAGAAVDVPNRHPR